MNLMCLQNSTRPLRQLLGLFIFIWFDDTKSLKEEPFSYLYKCLLKQLKSDKNTSTNRVDNPKQVLVPKTLRATMVLRMTEIDQVIIRGIQESSLLEKEVNMPMLLSLEGLIVPRNINA